jgi:hypothetical protein
MNDDGLWVMGYGMGYGLWVMDLANEDIGCSGLGI